jgi:hypothetical protein
MDRVLPQSRVEKDKDKQLHVMVKKYSSGEISCEQYTRTLGFKYQIFALKLKILLPPPCGE